MRGRCALAGALLALLPATAIGAVFRSGEAVTIPRGEPVDDDLYVAAQRVVIEAPIDGDLVVAAGEIIVNAPVRGDVLAAGGDVRLRAPVGGSVRAAGGTVQIEDEVGEDLVAAGGRVVLTTSARVARDVATGGSELQLDGTIGREAILAGEEIAIGGSIGGDVDVRGSELALTDGARIGGALRFAGEKAARIAPSAQVAGGIEQSRVTSPGGGVASVIYLRFRAFIAWTALGALLLLLAPWRVQLARDHLRSGALACLGSGALATVLVPAAAIVAMVIGAFLGGWWIGLAALALVAFAAAAGLVVVAIESGSWLFARAGRASESSSLALVAGALVVALVGAIPVAGPIALVLAAILGLGALLRSWFATRRGSPARTPPGPTDPERLPTGSTHVPA